MVGPKRGVRFFAGKGLFVVRTKDGPHGKLSAFGFGPGADVLIVPRPKARQNAAIRRGLEIVKGINNNLVAGGKKPIDIATWGNMRKYGVYKAGGNGKKWVLGVEPRTFSDIVSGRAEYRTHSQDERRAMLRAELRGGKSLLKRTPHTFGSGALLLVGDKYIVIPKRAENVTGYPGNYQYFAGVLAAEKKKFSGKRMQHPNALARHEIVEETGIPLSRVEFLGPGLKPSKKEVKPIVIARDMDTSAPGFDTVTIARARTKNPDNFLEKFFVRGKTGLAPRKAIDKWETRRVKVIPQSSRAINAFIAKNSWQMTPMSMIAMKALAVELKKKGR